MNEAQRTADRDRGPLCHIIAWACFPAGPGSEAHKGPQCRQENEGHPQHVRV